MNEKYVDSRKLHYFSGFLLYAYIAYFLPLILQRVNPSTFLPESEFTSNLPDLQDMQVLFLTWCLYDRHSKLSSLIYIICT